MEERACLAPMDAGIYETRFQKLDLGLDSTMPKKEGNGVCMIVGEDE